MRVFFCLSIVTSLLLATPGRCFAETMIKHVSKEQAREIGVTVRTSPNGQAGVKVWLEFKTRGKLKEFAGAELRMAGPEDQHIVSAPLLVSRSGEGKNSISVSFSAGPDWLDKSEFWILVDDIPRGGTGYRFLVKDFLEQDEK